MYRIQPQRRMTTLMLLAAISATNLVHLPRARHSRGALPYLKRILGILGSLNYCGIGDPRWQWPGHREGQKLGSVQIVDHPSRRMCCQDAKHERTWSSQGMTSNLWRDLPSRVAKDAKGHGEIDHELTEPQPPGWVFRAWLGSLGKLIRAERPGE